MKELSLQEIQQEEIHLLEEVDKICEKYGLTYYLAFGSLIGAVRHKDIIPWDDDLDLWMPSADIQKLAEIINSDSETYKPLYVITRKNEKYYPYGLPRITNTDFRYVDDVDRTNNKVKMGVFLDVYPLESYGNDEKTGLKIYKHIKRLNHFYHIYLDPNNSQNKLKVFIKYLVHFALRVIFGNTYNEKIDNRIDRYLEKHTSAMDRFVGSPRWNTVYFVHFDKSLIQERKKVPFNRIEAYIPCEYDAILKGIYGDYMKLPPEEKRVAYHHYKIFRKVEE